MDVCDGGVREKYVLLSLAAATHHLALLTCLSLSTHRSHAAGLPAGLHMHKLVALTGV